MGVALGIDLGTSGLRAALVDEAGAPVAFAAAPIPAADRREPSAWWVALETALGGLDLTRVRAVAVDGTSGTVLPVNAQGRPLAPASLYNEPADPADVARVAAEVAEDSAARGGTSPLARLLRWRSLPGVARVLHEADWLAGRLCGVFDTADAYNALKTGYDPRAGAWPDAVLALAGGLLPRVVPAGTVLGHVRPGLGLPAGAIVVAGTTDGCAAFLATGADRVGDAVTSLGSTLTLKLLTARPIFAPRHGIYSHLLRGAWLAGGASNTGGAALLRHFAAADLTRLSAGIDPTTSSGLDYYPLPAQASGSRSPIPQNPLATRRARPRTRGSCTGCWRASRRSRRWAIGACPNSGRRCARSAASAAGRRTRSGPRCGRGRWGWRCCRSAPRRRRSAPPAWPSPRSSWCRPAPTASRRRSAAGRARTAGRTRGSAPARRRG